MKHENPESKPLQRHIQRRLTQDQIWMGYIDLELGEID